MVKFIQYIKQLRSLCVRQSVRSGAILVSFFFTSFSLSLTASAGQLVASVDRDTLSLRETFTLTVTAAARVANKPDFSTLENDFEILSTSESQYTSISTNGAEFKKVWQLTLGPKREGSLLIPSFTVAGAVSDAIEIKVTQQSQTQTTSSSDDTVRVAIEVSKKNVFVQEQIHVKIQIVSKVNLSQTQMQPLEIKNAIVVPLEDKAKQFISVINGTQHLIEEQNFVIFPQESGELIIPSLIYSVVPSAERDLWNNPFGRGRSNVLRLPTEAQHITVKPTPTEAAGKPWLPATNLDIHETWSASLDHLKMGEPVTRTITIGADGLTGGQIPPLPTEAVDGLTFYPDQPQNTDTKTVKGIQGTRVETTAIIPNRGGEFTLPEINVEWWDTDEQIMKTATLPAKKITVLGSLGSANQSSQNLGTAGINTPENNPANDKLVVSSSNEKLNPWLWASSIAFAVLALILGIYVLHLKSQLKTFQNQRDDINEVISEKEKHIWDLLKHAAANKDAVALRRNVLSWAKLQWQHASIHSLDDVAKLAGNGELTNALRKLDELLYSNHPSDDWEPNYLLQLLNECRKEKNIKKKSEGLKPLYSN